MGKYNKVLISFLLNTAHYFFKCVMFPKAMESTMQQIFQSHKSYQWEY